MTERMSPARFVLVAAFVLLALTLVPVALADKGGGGHSGTNGGGGGGGHKGHKGSSTTYTGSFVGTNPVMVVDNNGNGLPNQGDTVTFNVSSTAPYPVVQLTCYQNGTQVVQESEGFYTGWLWGTDFYLGGQVWTSGAADCTAVLYSVSSDGTTEPTEATMSFPVGA